MRQLKQKVKMKKLSHRDWAIALIIGGLSFVLGFAVKAIIDSRKAPITVENPINEALKSQNDSLKGAIALKEAQVKEHELNDAKSDSIIFNNNKLFKKDYEKIEDMSDSIKLAYIDSVLKVAGKRK